VLDDLEAAARAYREAQAAVVDAENDLAAAKADVPRKRQMLAEAIVQAARDGVRQIDIVKITNYQREQVRRILRAGGVEAE
jgi:hypothetical protein